MASYPQMYVTITIDNPPKPHQLYKVGWNRYCDGLSFDGCESEDERRGWMAANRAEAAANSRYDGSEGW